MKQWMGMALVLVATVAVQGQTTQPREGEQAEVVRASATTQPSENEQVAATQPTETLAEPEVAVEKTAEQQIRDLQVRLSELLDETGVLRDSAMIDALLDVAEAATELGRANGDPAMQVEASQIALRARYAQVQAQLAAGQSGRASFALMQLRTTAHELKSVAKEQGEVVADYWLLLADIVDIQRNVPSLAQRQTAAAQRLQAFVRVHEQAANADVQPNAAVLVAARLAQVRLHDQMGDQAAAGAQIARLPADLPAEQRQDVEQVAKRCRLVGQDVAFELPTNEGVWRSAEHRGQQVVVLFEGGADQVVAALRAAAGAAYDAHEGQLAFVSVRLGRSDTAPTPVPWPTGAWGAGESVAALFGVTDLPWIVVLDEQGRVQRMGGAGLLETAF